MKSKTSGFTIIEVLLFLAVSAALIMGIIFSATSSIDRQRYDDSVQNFAEFLRTTYSEVENPRGKDSGDNGGRSDRAMYGKLITFGEAAANNPNGNIYVYDVQGDINESGSGSTIALLKDLHTDVIEKKNDTTKAFGKVNDYSLNWEAKVQNPDHSQFVGAILIVRSPVSGTVFTYSMTGSTVEVQKAIASSAATVLNAKLTEDSFKSNEVDFCIAAEGVSVYGGKRYDVRLAGTSHDASGVEVVSLDAESNRCK